MIFNLKFPNLLVPPLIIFKVPLFMASTILCSLVSGALSFDIIFMRK